MGRVYNFSAGPAVLPEEVLKEAADEMLDYPIPRTVFRFSVLLTLFNLRLRK